MRIELKYNFSCPSSRKLRDLLESVIAEEGLPLAIETVESDGEGHPTVRFHSSGTSYIPETEHELNCKSDGHEERRFLDTLRGIVNEKWADHSHHPRSAMGTP